MRIRLLQRLHETRVLENYSFMTALSIFSALIGLIIYPYVIRMTGKDAYGAYVYAFTIATFFQAVIDYGFDSPCAKAIVQARDNLAERSRVVTSALLLKSGFIVLCVVAFVICICYVPFMQDHFRLCLMTFIQLIATSLFPVWYFQGLKKMKFVTYINLALRLSTIPLIIWLVHVPEDISVYAFIVMSSVVLGTLIAYICLFVDGIRLQRITTERLRVLLHDSTPFFATSLTSSFKALAVKTIIKHSFGIGEVAIYDLAEKIVTIPRFFTQNINGALFPEVVDNATPNRVRRILKYERVIGISFAALVALLSYPLVLILGGMDMQGAVPVTIILSTAIYTNLVVGAYVNFVFIPANRYYYITFDQVIAFVSCVLLSLAGLYVWRDITMVAAGIMLSGFIEILFCYLLSRRISR
jgi:PST family polysaccharide transporter